MPAHNDDVSAVREFNRFYTRQIGLLDESLLKSDFSLTECRVLYELANRDSVTAKDLRDELKLDAGYLSRLLAKFERKKLISRTLSAEDARRANLVLTPAGHSAFEPINDASQREIAALLGSLNPRTQQQLISAMVRIKQILETSDRADDADDLVSFRSLQSGDIGWIAHRQGVLYNEEYDFDETFEALVAEILAKYVTNYDPDRESSWIAELGGDVVGSVFVVSESDKVARLRLLYVEPSTRGMGIGRKLVEQCIEFARKAGYEKITLWTNDVLNSARRIYESAGFVLVGEESHHSYGKDLVAQDWDLYLKQ